MNIAITSESTIDIPQELLDKYNIKTVPFTICFGDKTKLDGTFNQDELFEYYAKTKTLPKTSAVNEFQFKELFESLAPSYDAVLHLASSSGVSCACENAIAASKYFDNVYVIDTQTLCTGIALLAIYARELADKGLDIKEIVNLVEARKHTVQLSFILENLYYLYKGGRCSILQMLGANLLKIKPQIIMKDGKATSNHKYRGTMVKCFENYISDVFKDHPNPDLSYAFVSYTKYNEELINIAKKRLKERGFKTIYTARANSTICTHCGDTAVGILYLDQQKNKTLN